MATLIRMLTEYSKIKFDSNFGFAFNGEQSNPPDKKVDTHIRVYTDLFTTESSPVPLHDIGNWLDVALFSYVLFLIIPGYIFDLDVYRKDDHAFPAFAISKYLFPRSFQSLMMP